MNISDSERAASVLERAGYEMTSKINEADLIVVVMCSVRQSAVDRVHYLAHKFKKLKTTNCKLQTILTGCILKKDKKTFEKSFDYIVDINEAKNLAKIARQQALLTSRSRAGRCPSEARASEARISKASEALAERAGQQSLLPSGYIPIMTGCNNFCSYCVVPYTRGREISRPVKEIINDVKTALKNGVKKICLLGQNVNSFNGHRTLRGIAFGSNRANMTIKFPELLKLVDDIPGNFVLNFTTSHPKDFSDELVNTMIKCKKFSKMLNLPIQSGDDNVLKRMNRPYTVAQYKSLVKKIRKAIPDIKLSTDVIVGFPGETKKQFENTVKTLKEIGFGVAFINKYSPRPGTAAAKMKDDVPWPEKKRREKILIKLVNNKKGASK